MGGGPTPHRLARLCSAVSTVSPAPPGAGPSGALAATGLEVLLTTLFSDEQMASFGWRIPFVAGALLGLYGLLIRFRMAESHVFESSVEAAAADDVVVARPSVWRTLWSEKRAVLHISALSMSGVVVFCTWFIFAPSYAVAVHGMDAQHSLVAGLLAQGVFLAMIPVMGRLADRWGRKPLVFVFTLGFAVLAFPLEWMLGSGPVSLFASMGIASVLLAAACAPLGAIFTELVPTRVRATVVGFTYGGASAVFGGSAPYLNTWLSSQGMHAVFVAALIAACLVTAAVTLRMPETRTVELT
ncbi:MFS transporter [Kocuria sp. CPCC 205268]|uniref:MFS transporter n=1 Tax=Kocuria oxytropis TaxID=3058913 RepID=UPI0034D55BF3